MNSKNASEIIAKYKAGTCTEEELALVQDWIMFGKFDELNFSDTEILDDLREIDRKLPLVSKPSRTILWPKIAVVAAAAAAIVFGVYFFTAPRHPDTSSPRTAGRNLLNDIAPGRNGATITLGNGQVIHLSGAKKGIIVGEDLKYNDHTSVIPGYTSSQGNERSPDPANTRDLSQGRDDRSVQLLTASTSRGQTYQFTLPDGTKVWLNADSKIEFPSNFMNSKTRNVKLTGEGYFEVAKDKAHPFRVESAGQQVEVLGTHFNINAYANEESIKTTLLEGSVMVSHQGKQMSRMVLKPGMQSELDDIGLSSKEVDVDEIVAWKAGDFIFTKVSLADIMKSIARWYDVEVSYDPAVDAEQTFSVLVSRNKNISQILLSLENTGKVKFKIEGKKVKVGK
jgi:transmembrane sensor